MYAIDERQIKRNRHRRAGGKKLSILVCYHLCVNGSYMSPKNADAKQIRGRCIAADPRLMHD